MVFHFPCFHFPIFIAIYNICPYLLFSFMCFLSCWRKKGGRSPFYSWALGQGCKQGPWKSFWLSCKNPTLMVTTWASEISTPSETCDCPVPTPRAPCWAGCSQIWGAFSRKLWAPESEGKHNRGRILMQKACVDDLALILYNTENTCNILYDPLRIFLLQLWVTALER